jgi:DNA-binding transcriptional LysR family regulator
MRTLDPLAGVSAFMAVAEHRNFGMAAELLGMSRATVSAQVAELEKRLGVRLFQRSTRAVRLTEAGEAYRAALGGLGGQAEQAAQIARSFQSEAVGTIRMTAPDVLVDRFVLPALPEFLAENRGVRVDIAETSRRVDVIGEDFDLAIRASLAIEPNLIVRRLGSSPVTLTASPDYVARRGMPGWPEEIGQHDVMHHSGLAAGALWVMRRGGEERRVPLEPSVLIDSGASLCRAAEEGLGITYLPEFITGEAIRAGRLVRVLADWEIANVDVNAVYPSNRNITPKVKRFVAVLARRFIGDPDFS